MGIQKKTNKVTLKDQFANSRREIIRLNELNSELTKKNNGLIAYCEALKINYCSIIDLLINKYGDQEIPKEDITKETERLSQDGAKSYVVTDNGESYSFKME